MVLFIALSSLFAYVIVGGVIGRPASTAQFLRYQRLYKTSSKPYEGIGEAVWVFVLVMLFWPLWLIWLFVRYGGARLVLWLMALMIPPIREIRRQQQKGTR